MDPSVLIFLVPLLLVVFMFSSQRRRQRAFVQAQAQLTPGQDVVTTSGLLARLVEIDDAVAVLEISPGQHVRWDRRAVTAAAVPPSDPRPTDLEN